MDNKIEEKKIEQHPATMAPVAVALAQKGELAKKLTPQEQQELVDRVVEQNAALNAIEDASGV